MSARTAAVRSALVQAGEKGLLHAATQQNTGTWLGRCGRQVRGRDIRVWDGLAGQLHAETHEEELCPDCADLFRLIDEAIERAVRAALAEARA